MVKCPPNVNSVLNWPQRDLKGLYHHTLGYRAAAGDKQALSSTRQQI